MEHWIIDLAILVVVVAILGQISRIQSFAYNVRISIRGGTISIKGSALEKRHPEVYGFFREVLPGLDNAQVYGTWNGSRLALHYNGVEALRHQELIWNGLTQILSSADGNIHE